MLILILLYLLQTILKIPGFTDNVITHLLAGLGAGFFAVCIGSPVDVVIFLYPCHVDSFITFFLTVSRCFTPL